MDISTTSTGSEPRTGQKRKRAYSDRFIPDRMELGTPTPSLSFRNTNVTPSQSPYSSLSKSLGMSGNRLLSFPDPPPSPTPHLDYQRRCVDSVAIADTAAALQKRRPGVPSRVLDAPGIEDDFYLNIVDWSSTGLVAIALGKQGAYTWDLKTSEVEEICEQKSPGTGERSAPVTANEPKIPVTSLSWSKDGLKLAMSRNNGDVEVWDMEKKVKLRTMKGRTGRIPSLSWNGETLTSGCRDGSVWHHDVRAPEHKVMEFLGHARECSSRRTNLPDGTETPRHTTKWRSLAHKAAVKAIAWCPWQSNVLATAGGDNDRCIRFWSASTGQQTNIINTGSQVTSLIFSPRSKELLSTHGWNSKDHTNRISVWSYSRMSMIYDMEAHTSRVLGSALGPDGCTVVTTSADETLKFWKIWEAPNRSKVKDSGGTKRMFTGLRWGGGIG